MVDVLLFVLLLLVFFLLVFLRCIFLLILRFFFFFKQKTAYEMRISDWSSDVCSSDLAAPLRFSHVVTATGGTIVLMNPFDPQGALETIERHRVTHRDRKSVV